MGLWDWTKTAAGKVGSGLKFVVWDAPKAIITAPFKAETYKAIGRAREWAVDKANKGVLWLEKNPGKIQEEVWGFVKYSAKNPGHASLMFGQGLVKGVGSTAGMVCDAGRGIGRFAYNLGFDYKRDKDGNLIKDEDGKPVREDGYWKAAPESFSDSWRDGIGAFTDKHFCNKLIGKERNTYDKIWGYTGEAAFEVAGFVAASAATAGTAGLAWGAARAGGTTARVAFLSLRSGQTFAESATLIKAARAAKLVANAAEAGEAFSAAAELARVSGLAADIRAAAKAEKVLEKANKAVKYVEAGKDTIFGLSKSWAMATGKAVSPVTTRAGRAEHLGEKVAELTAKAEKLTAAGQLAGAEKLTAKAGKITREIERLEQGPRGLSKLRGNFVVNGWTEGATEGGGAALHVVMRDVAELAEEERTQEMLESLRDRARRTEESVKKLMEELERDMETPSLSGAFRSSAAPAPPAAVGALSEAFNTPPRDGHAKSQAQMIREIAAEWGWGAQPKVQPPAS